MRKKYLNKYDITFFCSTVFRVLVLSKKSEKNSQYHIIRGHQIQNAQKQTNKKSTGEVASSYIHFNVKFIVLGGSTDGGRGAGGENRTAPMKFCILVHYDIMCSIPLIEM